MAGDVTRLPWVCRKQVLPQDTDHAGVLWHGSYVAWLEEARVQALAEAGLDEDLEVTDGALTALVRGHAREAGVRTLQKLVEQIARKLALRTLRAQSPEAAATAPEGDDELDLVVDEATLPSFVGQPKFSKDRLYDDAPPAGGGVLRHAWI